MATTRNDTRRRPERVASRIQREVSEVLALELTDPRLRGVVVAGVTVTDDLSVAFVAFVVMGDDPEGARTREALVALGKMQRAVRARLAPRLGMRRVPEVRFVPDAGREEAARMDALLHEVGQELKKSEG